ncbi:viral A-type inclusion protein [Reticulomyxa filosa]|uniref:Viral A-type inclusion protein n=1 Tax=Reticulomyxa filosa TaxID=46433 RepID=X6NSH8_RETFI|nr:viral A-type inclusion protein [Reticulomyxa filosa]|eukprot:ETO28941.1 viral A-type inclusion protein [Reticulomyxa filosa]
MFLQYNRCPSELTSPHRGPFRSRIKQVENFQTTSQIDTTAENSRENLNQKFKAIRQINFPESKSSENEVKNEIDSLYQTEEQQMEETEKRLREKIEALKAQREKLEGALNPQSERRRVLSTNLIEETISLHRGCKKKTQIEEESKENSSESEMSDVLTFSDPMGNNTDSEDSMERTLHKIRSQQAQNLTMIESAFCQQVESSEPLEDDPQICGQAKSDGTKAVQFSRRWQTQTQTRKHRQTQVSGVDGRRKKKEEDILNFQFKASPVPWSSFRSAVQSKRDTEKKQSKQEDAPEKQFHAKEVPWFAKVPLYSAKYTKKAMKGRQGLKKEQRYVFPLGKINTEKKQ